jgi:hypothetical protein
MRVKRPRVLCVKVRGSEVCMYSILQVPLQVALAPLEAGEVLRGMVYEYASFKRKRTGSVARWQ